jgi:hypothetical protein
MVGAVDACERMRQHEVELHQTIVIGADKMYSIHCDSRKVPFFKLLLLVDDHHNVTDNELANGEATDREGRVGVPSRANRALGADVVQAVVLTDRGITQLDGRFDIRTGRPIEPAMTLGYGRDLDQVRPEERIATISRAKAIVEQAENSMCWASAPEYVSALTCSSYRGSRTVIDTGTV